jgi:hypothetical protein
MGEPSNKGMKLIRSAPAREPRSLQLTPGFDGPLGGDVGASSGRQKREQFIVARRPGDRSPARRLRLRTSDGEVEDLVLSAEELRRLRQGSASVRETRRYLIVSRVTPGFAFYYNVTDYGFGFNRPEQATLFHQRKQAEAVAALLGFGIEVVRCRTQVRKGARVPLVTPGLRERGARRRTGGRRTTRCS